MQTKIKVIEVNDPKVEIDAFKTALLFIYNAYKNVELTGDSALAVLYIGNLLNFNYKQFLY